MNQNGTFSISLWCLLFSLLFSDLSSAQICRIYGTVLDSASRESLPTATITISELGIEAIANHHGYYQISLPCNRTFTLIYRFVGYLPDTLEISIAQDTCINVSLQIVTLETVEVNASQERTTIGVFSIPVSRIKAIPVLLGEVDLFKSMALLPGISVGTEGSSGLYVRGGSPDQNLVLLDGSTVYNTSHLFGFISTFQPSAVKDIQVIKGGFPARYGGRLSSVINITMREGNRKERKYENNFGLLNTSLVREGPLQRGKGSYLFAARLAQLGIISLITLPNYYNGDPWLLAGMYDFNGKLNFQLRDSSRLFFSIYSGDDVWGTKQKFSSGEHGSTFLNWGNKTISLRYIKTFSPALFSQSMLNYNYFAYGVGVDSRLPAKGKRSVKFATSIQEVTARQWFTWDISPKHSLYFGLEGAIPVFKPNDVRLFLNDTLIERSAGSSQYIQAFSSALFLEDEWNLLPALKLNAGLRWSIYNVKGATFNNPEPRITMDYKIDNKQRWQLGYSRMVQFVHLITNSSNGLSNDLWLPATPRIPPQLADQFYGGWSIDFDMASVGSEVFYKKLRNQAELAQGANFLFNGSLDWQDIIETGGTGTVYGWELFLNKHKGKLTGWIAYTLSWNQRQFNGFNQGKPYPFQYDRRHDIAITLNYQLNSRIRCASNFIFQTGHALTLPEASHEVFYPNGEIILLPYYPSKNNHRMPNYHRLDFSFHYDYTTKRGRNASLTLGGYNIYGQPNPIYIEQEGEPVKLKIVTLFRFIPSLNYTVKW